MSDQVTLTLANPLTAEQAERLGAKAQEHKVGAKITVSRANARAVINAGYADGVDPEDHAAVRAALDGKQPSASTTASSAKASSGSGN